MVFVHDRAGGRAINLGGRDMDKQLDAVAMAEHGIGDDLGAENIGLEE